MPEAYLAVAVVGALVVANALWPVRRASLSNLSFLAGWLTGELAFQHIAWQLLATALFAWGGAFSAWPGWLGLGIAVADWAGLLWLGWEGHRAGRIVATALQPADPRPAEGEKLQAPDPRPAEGEKLQPADPRPAEGEKLQAPDPRPAGDGAFRPAGLHPFVPAPDPPQALWCRPGRRALAIPVRGPSIERIKDIDYWGDGRAAHRLDVLRRRQDPPTAAPVLVQVHGGAWVMGDKREQGLPLMHELAARGWVCVAVNYRLSPRATWPDHIVDVKRAIAWVRQHIADYGGDPQRIAVSGGSAGGHLAALAALTPGDPAFQPGFEDADASVMACVPFYGVYDMTSTGSARPAAPTRTAAPAGAPTVAPATRRAEVPGLRRLLERRVMKTPFAGHEDLYRAASPIARVRPDAPPFFVLHGTNDTMVPVAQARAFVAALRDRSRAPVAYAELPRAQHAFEVLVSPRSWASTAGAVAFLDAVAAAAAPPPPAGRPTDPPPPAGRPTDPAPPAGRPTDPPPPDLHARRHLT